jgi:hypothetical protein
MKKYTPRAQVLSEATGFAIASADADGHGHLKVKALRSPALDSNLISAHSFSVYTKGVSRHFNRMKSLTF